MSRAEEFEELRPLLFSIAYRMLGSVSEAEDAVQEAWVRYAASSTQPTSPRAYLSVVVTRISINTLRSARLRREQYVGDWFPEPLLEDPYTDPERTAELTDSVSMAALLLLERLSPLERAVFVLREVFGFGFDQIASTVERSEAACRQLAVRARRHMAAGPRFEADPKVCGELASRFFAALENGDLDGLRELLAAGGGPVSDSGGKAPALPSGVIGADNVARLLTVAAARFTQIGLVLEPQGINGQAGAIVRDPRGCVVSVLIIDIVDRQVQTVRSMVNPEKLRHLGPVVDPWAVSQQYRDRDR